MLHGKLDGKNIGSGTAVWQLHESLKAGEINLHQFLSAEGGMSRSAVNFSAGANTPLASIITAALLALALLPAAAWSADPALGTSKFSQNCAACHSVASTASVDRGRNSPAMIRNAISNVGAMSFLSSLSTGDLEDIAAYLGNTPSSLSFPATTVGQASTTQVVTVRASRTAALGSLAATASGDFVLQGGTCGTSLAASSSCTVGVAFAPGSAGSRSGSLSISHSGLTTPVTVALS
eukprot:gene61017-81352_t